MAAGVRSLIRGPLALDAITGRVVDGVFAELTRSFSQREVLAFVDLCGDDNPLHTDAEFAAKTRFKRPIVHGMLYGAMFGTIFGVRVPSSVYVSQTFEFKKPIYIDEVFTARIQVQQSRLKPLHLVTCSTTIVKEADGQLAMAGTAVVMLP